MVFNTDLSENILAGLPEIALTVLAAIVLFIDLYSPESRRVQAGYWAGIGLLGVALLTPLIPLPGDSLQEQLVLGGMLRQDEFTQIFRVMIYMAAGLCCLLAVGDNRLRYKGEFYLRILPVINDSVNALLLVARGG